MRILDYKLLEDVEGLEPLFTNYLELSKKHRPHDRGQTWAGMFNTKKYKEGQVICEEARTKLRSHIKSTLPQNIRVNYEFKRVDKWDKWMIFIYVE